MKYQKVRLRKEMPTFSRFVGNDRRAKFSKVSGFFYFSHRRFTEAGGSAGRLPSDG
jgi:hypothetical protein